MCGRFAQPMPLGEITKVFLIDEVETGSEPRYNISPGQNIAAVVGSGRKRRLVGLRWGLVPFWAKDPSIGNRLINARGETVESKPSFRNAFASRRCLIVAGGFFEWKKGGKMKQPFYIHLKKRDAFAFAGLFETWKPAEGAELRTCTIITTGANEMLGEIHDRMPVILVRESESLWLDPASRKDDLLSLIKPYPAEEMACFPVSTVVNSNRIDSPECIRPL